MVLIGEQAGTVAGLHVAADHLHFFGRHFERTEGNMCLLALLMEFLASRRELLILR